MDPTVRVEDRRERPGRLDAAARDDRRRRAPSFSTATACTDGWEPAASGRSGMARDERLERDVAVKILPRERIVGGRFEREARAAARLSHPGIVTLYEAAVDDDGAYLVSELVRGATLDELLAGRPTVRPGHRRRSESRCATRSTTPTRRASSTATSSRRTCWCPSSPLPRPRSRS